MALNTGLLATHIERALIHRNFRVLAMHVAAEGPKTVMAFAIDVATGRHRHNPRRQRP